MKKKIIIFSIILLSFSLLGCKVKSYDNVDELYKDTKEFVTSNEFKEKVKDTGKYLNDKWLVEK